MMVIKIDAVYTTIMVIISSIVIINNYSSSKTPELVKMMVIMNGNLNLNLKYNCYIYIQYKID